MFPMTVTISNPAQLNAVMAALNVGGIESPKTSPCVGHAVETAKEEVKGKATKTEAKEEPKVEAQAAAATETAQAAAGGAGAGRGRERRAPPLHGAQGAGARRRRARPARLGTLPR